MATNNGVNTGLTGATGTGSFVGSNAPALVNPTANSININATITVDGVINDPTMATATATNLSTSLAAKNYTNNQVAGRGMSNAFLLMGA